MKNGLEIYQKEIFNDDFKKKRLRTLVSLKTAVYCFSK